MLSSLLSILWRKNGQSNHQRSVFPTRLGQRSRQGVFQNLPVIVAEGFYGRRSIQGLTHGNRTLAFLRDVNEVLEDRFQLRPLHRVFCDLKDPLPDDLNVFLEFEENAKGL